MKIRKRALVATFHIVVAAVYLIMWLAKWSAGESNKIHMWQNKSATYVSSWHTPAADLIDDIIMLRYSDQECYISAYDNIFHRVCNESDTDWRMMSAIAYAESRFKPHVVSSGGAVGLMQIMPRTATIYGVAVESLSDPEQNIRVAVLHFNLIDYMLDLPDETSLYDRYSLVLACYNGGIGRVRDAQRLARYIGEDPYSWSVVSQQLLNLRDPEYYEMDIVRLGRFKSAGHTVSYVNSVLYRYDLYCIRTEHCVHHLYPITGHRY